MRTTVVVVKELTDLQLDVMRAVWKVAPASVSEIHEELSKTRDLAVTTVATLLKRLARDEALSVRREGRQLIYRAKTTENEIKRGTLVRLRDRLFAGDPVAIVQHLLTSGGIKSDDVRRIRSLIADAGKGRGK
jgi:BlaI family penicillinase repressor